MARMIPTRIPKNAPPSEKLIFDSLKQAFHSSRWIVFHSEYVKNPKHPVRPREIDFLILMRPPDNMRSSDKLEYCAIVCLEVKGGSWRREGGNWYRMPGKHAEQPPPKQASGAMFAFKKEFKSYFQSGSLLSIGCAVAFTDAKYLSGKGRPQPALIIEKDDACNPDKLGRKLAEYAATLPEDSVKDQLDNNEGKRLEAEEALGNLQRELEESVMITTRPETIVRQELETLGKQLLRLTTEQNDCLEEIQSEWNPRCVVEGAAGTGKTVLAMELAQRLCHEGNGNNVALLCSNPYLSSRFQRWTKTLSKDNGDNGGRVVAGTPATLPLEALSADETRRNRHQARLNASPELKESLKPGALNYEWRGFINETIQDLNQGGVSFDYLIVDEAQNLCEEVFLDLMNALLKGGLKDGRWTMFGDFKYQHILYMDREDDKDKRDVRIRLRGREIHSSTKFLNINCRNTYEIAAAFAMFADIVSPPISGVHGPLIQIEFFESEKRLDELLERLVSNLKVRKIDSRQIILLANDNDDFGDAEHFAGWKLQNIRDATADTPLDSERALTVSRESFQNKLRCSDIYDFQGLESEVAILVMPLTKRQSKLRGMATMPHYEHLRRILYTGMSRAKALLIIVAHKSYRNFLKLDSEHGRSYKDHIELLRNSST